MSSFGIQIPITGDSGDGFTMLKTIKQTVKQNLKMLILTNPGERVMIPQYGVGLKTFLFEAAEGGTKANIEQRIKDQIARYMPVIKVKRVIVAPMRNTPNGLSIQLTYSIPKLGIGDILEITI
tara:strand:+ start:387 stop:755 length:369 start_codon:yes stop_codon:yes gene_type:complete